jgi:hypothetical protein
MRRAPRLTDINAGSPLGGTLFFCCREDALSIRRAGILLSLLALSAVSEAKDYGQYRNLSPEIKSWIEGLRDAYGVSCCATADGYRPEEVEWDMAGNNYRVKIDNTWIVVPDKAVIKGPNRIGYAIVWLYGSLDFDGSRMVRCFLPGPTS